MSAIQFATYEKSTGKIISHGHAPAMEAITPYETDTIGVYLGDANLNQYILAGSPVNIPARPSVHHNFNYTTKLWSDARTLQDHKDARWLLMKARRSEAEYAGFTWDGSTFDSDQISQQRITGAVTLAQMDTAFTIGWTLANNTVRTLNQTAMLSVGAALGQHVGAIFAYAVTLRNAIEASASVAEIEAVAW